MGKIFSQRTSNTCACCRFQLRFDLRVSQLQTRHTRHERVAPAKDFRRNIDQIWPGDRDVRALVEQPRIKLFGGELPPEMGIAAQHIFAFGTADKDVLPEQAKRNRLRANEASQIKMVKCSLKLLIRD